MADVLIASDSQRLRNEVRAVLTSRDTVREVTTGKEVLPAVKAHEPDLVVLDMQIGTMGGMAVSLELRLEESADRLDHIPVLLLVDRRPDVYLAKRAQADGYLVKPLDPIRLRRAVAALVEGGTFADDSFKPVSA